MRNINKGLAIFFGILAIGGCSETFRILTSSAPDIVKYRSELIPMAIIFQGLLIYLAYRYWKKYKDDKPLKF
jgi:hypothetical protein